MIGTEIYVLEEGYGDCSLEFKGAFNSYESAVNAARSIDSKFDTYVVENYFNEYYFVERGYSYFNVWKITQTEIK